jgi:hypothetical protein
MLKTVNETGNLHGMVAGGPTTVFKLNGEEMSLGPGETISWSPSKGKELATQSSAEPAASEAAAKVNDRAAEKTYAAMDQALEWSTPGAIVYLSEELQKLGVDIPEHYRQAYESAKAGSTLRYN